MRQQPTDTPGAYMAQSVSPSGAPGPPSTSSDSASARSPATGRPGAWAPGLLSPRPLVVSLNCRDEFPQTVDKDAPERAMYPGNEAERARTTVRSSSRHDLSVWPPSLA